MSADSPKEKQYWENVDKSLSGSTLALSEDEYWRAWNKANPKPVNIELWGQDEQWANPTNDTPQAQARGKYFGFDTPKALCPEHGEPLVRTYDMRTQAFGCPTCLLQLDWSNRPRTTPDFINKNNPLGLNPYLWRLINVCAKKGLKGNQVPKNGEAYLQYVLWQDKRDKAAQDFGRYVERNQARIMASSDMVSLLAEKVRSGEIELNPKAVATKGISQR